ncbi:hypothetical protein L7F22_050871 [Adiantum nelumboides]|nr:hypothetical protein [Adiantum nelumboides]
MACPCCGLCSKLDTLDGNIVNLYSKSNQSVGLSRRVKATRDADYLQELDANAQKRLNCSLSSRSHRGRLSSVRRLQQKNLNEPSMSSNGALRSKTSANSKHRERRTLAFVLHDEDVSNECLRTKLSPSHSDKLKPFPLKSVEMQAFHATASHTSSISYSAITPDNMNPSYAKLHGAKDFAGGRVSDLDDSEESEREIEGAICLSSFKFNSTKYLPPSLELIANGKKSLVRKLSSESCISMLSLDCTDDQLSGDECVDSFPSEDLSLQADMTGFSVCFSESRAIINDEANVVKPFCQVGGSGSIEPNLEMQGEAVKFSGLSFPPLEKLRSTSTGQKHKYLKLETRNKKRPRSSTHETRRCNDKTRKASLNLHACKGLAGLISGGTDIYRAFNLGVGIGVAYMLFANWNELKKLNFLLERTEALVKDVQQQPPRRASPLLGCFSALETSTPRKPEALMKDIQQQASSRASPLLRCFSILETSSPSKTENDVEASQPEGLKTDGADELILKNRNMAELEAALEAELALMQHNLEAELQVTPGGFDKEQDKEGGIITELTRDVHDARDEVWSFVRPVVSEDMQIAIMLPFSLQEVTDAVHGLVGVSCPGDDGLTRRFFMQYWDLISDSGLLPFDDKLKAIFLLMTLLDSWETLVVSLSNNPNLTFDGVRGSILNEEIRRKASGEGGSSANMVRGRTEKKNAYAQRSKSKTVDAPDGTARAGRQQLGR